MEDGHPIFAIETFLDPLQKRIAEKRTADAIEVVKNIRASIENAKGIVDQFKSLARHRRSPPSPCFFARFLRTPAGRP